MEMPKGFKALQDRFEEKIAYLPFFSKYYLRKNFNLFWFGKSSYEMIATKEQDAQHEETL